VTQILLTMEESVFYVVRAATIAMQWFGKHVSKIEAVFSAWSVRRLYNDSYRHPCGST
jgi:hypothetical protein